MTQTSNRILDDLARLMTDAAGLAQGARREMDGFVRAQLERVIADMDVVDRDAFEAVREMAIAAREENDRLRARIEALEARLGPVTPRDAIPDIIETAAPKRRAKPSGGSELA